MCPLPLSFPADITPSVRKAPASSALEVAFIFLERVVSTFSFARQNGPILFAWLTALLPELEDRSLALSISSTHISRAVYEYAALFPCSNPSNPETSPSLPRWRSTSQSPPPFGFFVFRSQGRVVPFLQIALDK